MDALKWTVVKDDLMNGNTTKTTIYLDGKQAEAELKLLGKEVDKYSKKMNAARKANDKAGFDRAQAEYKNAKREMSKYKRTVVDVMAVLNNLNGSSLKQLIATQRKLNTQINESKKNTKAEIAAYKLKVAQLKKVKGQITKVRMEMGATAAASQSMFSRMANAFNKYSMIIATMAGTIYGLVAILKKAVEASDEFYSSVSNLSALTGLTGAQLEYLQERALSFAGSITPAGIKITQSARDIIEAYTQMGSKRPELLQNKKDLADVTEQAIILSIAARMELVPSTQALAMSLNMFNESAKEAPRHINALAAGSKLGAANIAYLTAAIEKSGREAKMANLSIEQHVALIETIAPGIAQASRAGINLRNILLKLQSGQDQYNPTVVGMTQALDNLASANLSAASLTKMFTVRNQGAAKALIEGREEYKRFFASVSDTNIAQEQAIINTDNHKAKLQMLRQHVANLTIELGEKLTPALSFSIHAFGKVIKVGLILVNFFQEYKAQIMTITAAIIAWTTVTKIQSKWIAIQSAYIVAQKAIIKAWAWTIWTVTDATKVAAAAQKAWNWAIRSNPIGLIVTAIAALGTALYFHTKKVDAATKAERNFTKALLEQKKRTADHKVRMEANLRIVNDQNKAAHERQAALGAIIQINEKYLAGLTLENVKTEEGIALLERYNKMLHARAKQEAAYALLKETEAAMMALEMEGKGAELDWWQKTKIAIVSGFNAQSGASYAAGLAIENLNEKEEELIATKKKLYQILDDTANIPPPAEDPTTTDSVKTLRQMEEALAALKAERRDINVLDTDALMINAKQINQLEAEIKLYKELGIAKKTSKSKFNPKDLDAPLNDQDYWTKYKYDTLKKYRQDDIKDIEACIEEENLMYERQLNEQLLALGDDYKAKALLEEQYNKDSLQRQIIQFEALQQVFEEQMHSLQMEDSILSEEERDIIQSRIEEIKLAISALKLLLGESEDEEGMPDDDSAAGLLTRMIFGKAGDVGIAEKIQAIGTLAMDAFNSINSIISNAEQRHLQEFEAAQDKKRMKLQQRLEAGRISEEKYNAAIIAMDDALDAKKRKLAYQQAKRQKEQALLSAIINTAVAVTGALGNPPGPAGIVMGIIVGLLGALQIAAIASEPLPQYRAGNYKKVIGAEDGKTYNAKLGNNKTRLVNTPTYEPGLGLVGEDDPELVFSGGDTDKILNSPELVRAINQTIGVPQFSEGNATGIIKETNTIHETSSDPQMLALLTKLSDQLDNPQPAQLVANEEYINVHNQTKDEYETFNSRIN